MLLVGARRAAACGGDAACSRGYRALAVASALTVLAYAIDVVVGSPLTSLSLLGPNPGLGVRFYGIGNELEALLVVLVVAGTGAALAGFAAAACRRAAAPSPSSASACSPPFVFAAGPLRRRRRRRDRLPGRRRGRRRRDRRPAQAHAAARDRGTVRRRWRCWRWSTSLSGANAHLTRSVLDAGGLGDLSDVAQRRLQLSAHSFARPVLLVFLPLVAALAVLAIVRRDRLRAWVAGPPAMRAGLLGAWRPPSSAPWPTTQAPCCWRSAPPTCSSSPASPGRESAATTAADKKLH